MKRKWLAALCLLAVAMLLPACQGQQQNNQVFTEVTQYLGPATDTPVPVNTAATGVSDGSNTGASDGGSVFSNNPYVVATDESFTEADAMNEEQAQVDDSGAIVYGQADANATAYLYAGATPIPLDPVDAPTPTPRPTITFTYVQYDLPVLGLSFQGPAGWVPDDTVSGVYSLTEPAEQIKENQLGVVTLYASLLNNNYSEAELTTEIKQRLDTISTKGFTQWKPSYTATRYLMGSKGVYANYSGTLADGTQVGGRVHAVCIDKVLYCLEISYPLNFKDDYLNVFSKVRETLKRSGT